jgi:hypothetical protein
MRRRSQSDNGKENTMSKNAMAGAVTLCGVGLCMMGGAMLMQSGGQAHAAGGAAPVAAIAAGASMAQAGGERTVVWYGCYGGGVSIDWIGGVVLRAWSDGVIEMKRIHKHGSGDCGSTPPCVSEWIVISSPTSGYRAAADINADALVDGVDLASVLNNWGSAPRVPFPPSECPLNLINP